MNGSDLFDAAWYRSRYPDVMMLGMDPAAHYLWLGARLGRNPSPGFDTVAYLAINDDVARAGINPLLHFLRFGQAEGRWITPAQDDAPAHRQGGPLRRRSGGRPTLNWVMNPDNVGWAYGNNARMLAAQMPFYDHIIDGFGITSDVALYFDIKVFKMRGRMARRNVLRVGGPRPIMLDYGNDTDRLARDLDVFDAVIVLNQALFAQISALHPDVHLIPNALDLDVWAPDSLRDRGQSGTGQRPFTVGFAANLTTTSERALKGFDLVEAACKFLDVPLLHFGKGRDQIPREEMQARFYGEIDCLVHPVAPGKEGCSNVIMEALAMGVPVITTRDAGFHAELIADADGLLYVDRDAAMIAAAIDRLRQDAGLYDAMGAAARRFALAHHDIGRTAQAYARVLAGPEHVQATPALHFVPFWEPPARFASARLRCVLPVDLLKDSPLVEPVLSGRDLAVDDITGADVVLVSQLTSDATLKVLTDRPDIPSIYDLCDRYFDDDRMVGGVHAKTRFFAMADRAAVITTSTVALKRQIVGLGLRKPVVWIPDGIDYPGRRKPTPSDPTGPILWYGNPGRGNFTAARWMIDHVMQNRSEGMRIISARGHFAHAARTDPVYAHYADICIDWEEKTFVSDLRTCRLCVIAHSAQELTKSPNRLVTAIMNGVPVIVADAPACAALLRAGGMDWAVVQDKYGLDAAIARLSGPADRQHYLTRMQAIVEATFGDSAIRNRYEALLRDHLPGLQQRAEKPIRVLFVSHNLNVGEGAPTSLVQTVTGLKAAHSDIVPVVFSVMKGALGQLYETAGISVIVPETGPQSRLATQVISRRQDDMAKAFAAALRDHAIDLVLVNTATSLWFVTLAKAMGVPTLAMIRESSAEHVAFAFGPPDVMEACRAGLDAADRVIFVSDQTRKLWTDSHALQGTALIPNGIDLSHFGPALAQDKTALRAELGLPPDGLILLSVGSINARKSQGDIVAALAALPQAAQQKVHLVLVGAKPSPYLDGLRAQITALDPALASRIRIEPETDDIGAWYRAADVFVFASLNESYPRVIIEAMAFDLPIISSAIFGTQEQIVEGQSGLLFPPGDVAALADCLNRVIGDAALRAALADGAGTRVWELVTYSEMVHRTYVQIRQVMAGNTNAANESDKSNES